MEIIPPVFSYLFEYSWRDLEGTLSFVFPSTSSSTSGDILRMPPRRTRRRTTGSNQLLSLRRRAALRSAKPRSTMHPMLLRSSQMRRTIAIHCPHPHHPALTGREQIWPLPNPRRHRKRARPQRRQQGVLVVVPLLQAPRRRSGLVKLPVPTPTPMTTWW